jgi:hypothetical protein
MRGVVSYRRSEVSRALILFGNKIYTYVKPGTISTQMYILFRNAQLFHMNILFPNGGSSKHQRYYCLSRLRPLAPRGAFQSNESNRIESNESLLVANDDQRRRRRRPSARRTFIYLH